MVHMVKGRQYNAYTVPHAGTSIAEMESETDSTSTVKSFDVGTNSTPSELQISRSWHATMRAIYSTRSPWDYVSREVRPVVLVRGSSSQLIRYSLDTGIRYSTYLPIFKSQKGSSEALNFLILTS